MTSPAGHATTIARRALCAIPVLMLLACSPDTEESFRAEISDWLALGDTVHFNATRSCTAGAFETRSGRLTSAMRSATSWRDARRAIDAGQPVAFESISLTPSDFTGIIMDEEPALGNQIISAGLAIRDCLDDSAQDGYYTALRTLDATLMFDPETQTIGILTADRSRIYAGRGDAR